MANNQQHIKHTVSIKLSDGASVDHTAEAIRYKPNSDGSIAVFACCCGKEDEGSWHSFYDVAKMTPDQITAEVQSHVKRKAEHHSSVHLARDFMHTLLKEGAGGQKA